MGRRLFRGFVVVALTVGFLSPAAADAVEKNALPIFKQVSAGLFHTCAITVEGDLFCWGSNGYGQLGTGDEYDSNLPRPVSGDIAISEVVQVAAGDYHTCAVTLVGDLYCWGSNVAGLLGVGNPELESSPTPLLVNGGAFDNASAKYVSVDSFNTCAITSNDQVACWGSNLYGQIGRPEGSSNWAAPTLVNNGALAGRTVSKVKVGGDQVCAITDRERAACWGRHSYLLNGYWVDSHRPRVVNSGFLRGKAVTDVSHVHHACAVTKGKRLTCWGQNGFGEIGNNSSVDQILPIRVNSGSLTNKYVESVSLSYGYSCAITTAQKLSCWGLNDRGQIGDNSVSNRSEPVLIRTGALKNQRVSSVSTGQYHTCAITTLGSVACWGDNEYGQVGDGTNINRLRPKSVVWVE